MHEYIDIGIVYKVTVNVMVSEALSCSAPISLATATPVLMKIGFDSDYVIIGDGVLSAGFRNSEIFKHFYHLLCTFFACASLRLAAPLKQDLGTTV